MTATAAKLGDVDTKLDVARDQNDTTGGAAADRLRSGLTSIFGPPDATGTTTGNANEARTMLAAADNTASGAANSAAVRAILEGAAPVRDGVSAKDISGEGSIVKDSMTKIEEMMKKLKEPSEKDIADAQKLLADKVTKLATPEDQDKLKQLGNDLLSGNLDGVKKALGEITDPEKKKAMVEELNKNLEGSGTRVQMDADGNVIISRNDSDRAIKVGADGKTRVVEARQNPDGTTTVGGERVGADANKEMKNIANDTVNGINHPGKHQFGEAYQMPKLEPNWPRRDPILPPGIGGPRIDDPGFDPDHWRRKTMLIPGPRAI